MSHDPNAPVVIGAAGVSQRFDDPTIAADAISLMRSALEAAADDAGSRRLLERADVVMIPQGTWACGDPAAVVAPWSPTQRSIVADIGVLQQTLLGRACAMVASGEARVVLVCGAEAKFRALRGQILGVDLAETVSTGDPDERMAPAHEILTAEEIQRGLPVPARQYALIDTALRIADGMSPAQHVDALARLWSGFSDVASANPDAWSRSAVPASTLAEPSAKNPVLAWPYTKLHCSQWNVDQSSALIVCSAEVAEQLAIARDRWVFAHAGIESNLMVPVTLRADIHRSPAVVAAGAALREHTGVAPDDVELRDIYSCFPAAVRVQAGELELSDDRPLTVTGGMTFGGGPLNNYTLQSTARMMHLLRDRPDAHGLVSNVSGMLTKYGLALWSCRPPVRSYASIDVTDTATETTSTVELDPAFAGPATVVTYTVACDRGTPVQGIVVGDNSSGNRVLATTTDADTMHDMMANDWAGRSITVDGPTLRHP